MKMCAKYRTLPFQEQVFCPRFPGSKKNKSLLWINVQVNSIPHKKENLLCFDLAVFHNIDAVKNIYRTVVVRYHQYSCIVFVGDLLQ